MLTGVIKDTIIYGVNAEITKVQAIPNQDHSSYSRPGYITGRWLVGESVGVPVKNNDKFPQKQTSKSFVAGIMRYLYTSCCLKHLQMGGKLSLWY